MKASKKTKSLSTPAAVQFQRGKYNLPSHDALAQILPDNQLLLNRAKTGLPGTAQLDQKTPAEMTDSTENDKPNINSTYQVPHPHTRPPLHDFEDDPHVAKISGLQTKALFHHQEIENYRSALSRMAEDIITLRTQVLSLEAENSQLRSDLSLQQDLGRDLLADTDIDVMTKAEIADRIATLKFKLASEVSKATTQRDRIQHLQNELIRKNDSEQELLKLRRVLQQEQKDLQHHQSHLAKMATLEATVKQQGEVIEKMEKALDGKLRDKNSHRGDKRLMLMERDGLKQKEMKSALAAENARLRKELERIHQLPAPLKTQQSDQEEWSLQHKLERAEARIQTLEAQLEENAKVWGREKQEMLTKLSEHRHGFIQTSKAILQNVPSLLIPAKRTAEAKPGKRPANELNC
ncbi:coiled-coil domain-containing protein 33 isoform X1 [Oreochromis niloticus]|uniref:coiled-coil domain-containing protein 33 isoform X1 n=1 Tax=Oreochromis niloticus TaxID=8128 RepID=UPI000DF11F4E|nr:coiled-coil domain-containing protein 33 isoform X1 [Oreochromis niloticus]